MDEKRNAARRRTLLTGRIEFRDKSTFSCVVRNISDGGARLTCEQAARLPEAFSLVVDKLDMKRTARAVWRTQNEVGLQFDAAVA